MSEQYSFFRSDIGGSILVYERKSTGEFASDPCAQIWLDQDYYGVTYSAMFKVGNGFIEVDDNGVGRIL
jgi:hypothetical protein